MNLKKIPKKLLLKGGKIFDPNSDKLKKADILIEKIRLYLKKDKFDVD